MESALLLVCVTVTMAGLVSVVIKVCVKMQKKNFSVTIIYVVQLFVALSVGKAAVLHLVLVPVMKDGRETSVKHVSDCGARGRGGGGGGGISAIYLSINMCRDLPCIWWLSEWWLLQDIGL